MEGRKKIREKTRLKKGRRKDIEAYLKRGESFDVGSGFWMEFLMILRINLIKIF